MLFKYLEPDRIDVLASGHIRFTQPADFNDPFEFQPVISSVASKEELDKAMDEDLKTIVQEELQKLPSEIRTQISPAQLEAVTRKLYEQHWPSLKTKLKEMGSETTRVFVDKANTLIGVLSLTEKNDNLLMWSHYAYSHKGFCIGFDKNSPFFNRKRSEVDEFYHLRKVSYSKMRPSKLVSQLSGVELFLIKSKAWEYEQEWRMCAVLEDSEKTISTTSLPIHLFQFPNSALKEIILGACIEKNVKEHILSVVRKNYPHITIKQAKISNEEYGLEFIEL
ncbi:DUF2971 domain-containing protein [Pseudoalteromonas atlantica]|uniref:DUF2971 domain-containing protein n=1 Tax=Pseudoalteromonas atlantica TaxID=288 RepID=UPI0037358F52